MNNEKIVPLLSEDGKIISGNMIIEDGPVQRSSTVDQAVLVRNVKASYASSGSKEIGVTFHTVDCHDDSLIDLANISPVKLIEDKSTTQDGNEDRNEEIKADEVIKPPAVMSILDNGSSLELGLIAGLTDLNSLNDASSKFPTKIGTARATES